MIVCDKYFSYTMKIRFNHVVLATVAIVFIVTSANAKSVPQNPFANNQATQAVIMANVENVTEEQAKRILKEKVSSLFEDILFGETASLIIRPVERIDLLRLMREPCENLGLTVTSTGECKPKFVDE